MQDTITDGSLLRTQKRSESHLNYGQKVMRTVPSSPTTNLVDLPLIDLLLNGTRGHKTVNSHRTGLT